MARVAGEVYSTGQTEEDFFNIRKLIRLWHGTEDITKLPDTPALTDPYYAPPDRGALLLTLNIITVTIATVAVILRFYDRRLHLRRLNNGKPLLDDYCLALALALTWVVTALSCYGAASLQWGFLARDLKFLSISISLKVRLSLRPQKKSKNRHFSSLLITRLTDFLC